MNVGELDIEKLAHMAVDGELLDVAEREDLKAVEI